MTVDAPWWQKSTVYQIYPRSFADSNGDGVGDLGGILARLDYLRDLGIDVIWLSPIFASPMDDNGYDISDYQDIAPEFGTLAEFDALVSAARQRGIGILLDLVVNHTSDEHQWFRDARASRDSAYRDYYIWRDPGADGAPPTDLKSIFGGPAWTLDPATGQYYLHQFSRRQPDLNWENPQLRAEIYKMMNWWLDRGIAGFRMDVIDLIGKQVDKGIMADGPLLHDYLQEMHRETFGGRNLLTVGETWSATPESARLYSGANRGELSMVFQFEHVTQQWHETWGKWQPKGFDLVAFKAIIDRWQKGLAEDGWNSLFWGNHDLPRAVSKYGHDGEHHAVSAKMLATALHFLKGTPYVYQGEEIGMTNAAFAGIEQFRDIETLNMYREHLAAGLSAADFIAGANANGRDNARTPMHWSPDAHGGFTSGTPWIDVNPNHTHINVAAQLADEESILAHYKRLIALRKALPIIQIGRFDLLAPEHDQIMAYTRTLGDQQMLVLANFSDRPARMVLPTHLVGGGQLLVPNYPRAATVEGQVELRPYEAFSLLR